MPIIISDLRFLSYQVIRSIQFVRCAQCYQASDQREMPMKQKMFESGKTARLVILGVFFCLVAVFYSASACAIWPFEEKETEVRDDYLVKLFAPDIPHESVKVVEDSKGNRFIVVRFKEKIKDIQNTYNYNGVLLKRGVNVYGTYHHGAFSWQSHVTDYAITITRKVEGEPDTVEVSESMVTDPETGQPIVAASISGKEVRFAIESSFGNKWRKIRILPENDMQVRGTDLTSPDFPRYPGAVRAAFMEYFFEDAYKHRKKIPKYVKEYGYWTIYVVKAPIKDVAMFYYKELKKEYPETAYGSLYWEEQIANPSKAHYAVKVFGVKTVGLYVIVEGYTKKPPYRSTNIRLKQSNDPNLSDYTQIMFLP